jgi:hypothetical protein
MPCEAKISRSMVESLSILLNINNGNKTIKNKNYYLIGDVLNCVDCRSETIHVKYIGLKVNISSISMELAFFPFLFPCGNGAYDGNISFNKYINY